MLHRSNENFEHCYALDTQPDIESAAKTACWSDWLENYSQGQSQERIHYARDRRNAIEHNDVSTIAVTPEAVAAQQTSGSEAVPPGSAAPAPASTTAATPATATATAPATTAASPPEAATSAPATGEVVVGDPPRTAAPLPVRLPPRGSNPACASVCDPHYMACADRCDRADLESCYHACEAEHRTCSAGCF